MRRRMINSTLAVVLVVISVFGLSLAAVETRTIDDSARENARSEAVRLISAVENRMVAGESVVPKALRRQVSEGRYARIQVPGQAPIELGRRPSGELITSASTCPCRIASIVSSASWSRRRRAATAGDDRRLFFLAIDARGWLRADVEAHQYPLFVGHVPDQPAKGFGQPPDQRRCRDDLVAACQRQILVDVDDFEIV